MLIGDDDKLRVSTYYYVRVMRYKNDLSLLFLLFDVSNQIVINCTVVQVIFVDQSGSDIASR